MVFSQSRLAIWCYVCLLAAAASATVGCSGRPSNVAKKVSGTVTLGGQPLVGAKIAFAPEKGNASFGVTDAEGKYNMYWSQARGKLIEGAIIGEHTVEISTFQPGNPTAKTPVPDVPEKVPYKYRTGADKPKATVKAGANVIDFTLEAGPVEPPQPKGKKKGK